MRDTLIGLLKAPVFPDDEAKSRRARALHALHLNMGGALLILGSVGILFVFAEKVITTLVLSMGVLTTVAGMILNRRGYVRASSIIMLVVLWSTAVFMSSLSGGIHSLDIIFFVSGTVVAGITLGASGAYSFAALSLFSGLGMLFAEWAGYKFPELFTFPPGSAWIILFINLVFTVVPLQVALRSLSDSALRASLSEERYRLIASVTSDYAFSIQYGPEGEITDQSLSGAFASITGYTPEEYFARGGWLSILHPDDKEQDARDMAMLYANQKVVTEVRILRKDGRVLWVRAYGHPLWDDKHNRLAGIYGAVQDITDRKQVETNLQRRAEEMSLLYQITLALTSEADLYHALRALVKELKHVMSVDAFHIGLYDEQTDVFSYSLFLNLDEDLQLPSRKLSERPGLTKEVISSRQTLYLADISDPDAQRTHNIVIVVDAGIRSYIGIPLMLQEQVIGIMSVQSCLAAAYTLEQIRLLETLAGQVAITIQKSQLLAQLQRRESLLEAITFSAEQFLKTPEFRENINIVLERLGREFSASHAYLFEQYPNADGILFKSLRYEWTALGQNPDIEKPIYQNVPAHGTGFERYYQILDQGAPFVGSTSYFTDTERKRFELSGIKALLEMQIFIDGKPWGIIGFDETEHEREWTAAEVDVIRVAANVLGSAIKRQMDEASLQNELAQRKLLIEELKLRNAESETLRETTAIVASALDISEAIHRILEQLKRMVYYDSASVWLYRGNQATMVGYDGLPPDAILPGQYELDDTQPDYPLRADYAPYILIDDIQELYTWFQEPSLSYIHGWMAVPLRARGILIGFISLDGRAVGQFSEHDAQMALTYANQVSIALENARLISDLQTELEERKKLVEELRLRNKESETLRESAAIVAATLEQSEAVDRILEQLEKVVHYNSASVQLWSGDMLEIVSSRGLDFIRGDIGVKFPVNEKEPSYPVLQGYVPYILYEDVQVSVPLFNEIPHDNIHAWMAIPLKAKGQVAGIIALDGQQVGQFTERDAQLAVTYANQVAIALENARLFGELQEKYAERQKLIDELESKNAELERFTYTVSHDLRSPLVTIKGFLGYLERSAATGNMDNFHKDKARISAAADRMDGLLKDLLELSRIGRLVNKPSDVPFDELVQEATEIVHGRLEARGITLQTQPNLPLVHVDKPRLIEVLQNLIDNAAKYMGAQKEPRIEIGMQAYDKSGSPIFFVRDNGMGIEPQYHERIFRLFDKLDPNSDGTGVGLALVKRIIEFHGGRIWVASQTGKGSTFYFTLQNSLQA